ncbi:MAG: TetR/AcrR family transcriptional regulator [Halioglobus sp.]
MVYSALLLCIALLWGFELATNRQPVERDKAVLRRQHILETAERLFAERGVENVSLNEINKTAGQKNTSALHYHFSNRQGLLYAIVDQHSDELRPKIAARLGKLERVSDSTPDPHDFVSSYIGPYVQKLSNVRGVRFLQIMAMMLTSDPIRAVVLRDTKTTEDLRPRIQALMNSFLIDLSQEERNMRALSFGLLMFSTLSAYSHLDKSSAKAIFGSKTKFVQHLKAILVAVLTAERGETDTGPTR